MFCDKYNAGIGVIQSPDCSLKVETLGVFPLKAGEGDA